MIDVKPLQRALGVNADGDFGPTSCAALFFKCGAKLPIAEELGLAAAVHFPRYGLLDAPLRLPHFMAQLGHESDGFKAMEEYASGAAYEGRRDLGNTAPGDGVRFKGRGPIQCTGRANYRYFGRKIGIDLERHPEVAAIPSIGLHVALEYWADRRLNELADANNLEAITRRINGGLNGLADRTSRLQKIADWLD